MSKQQMIGAAALAGLASLTLVPVAAAAPDLPPQPPYIPGDVSPQPGSFDYPYNIIVVAPPATTDARGVKIHTNAGAGQQLSGLPGSQLGNTGQAEGSLTNSSAQYGISVGNSHPEPPNPGIGITAGPQTSVQLESPDGRRPESALGVESSLPNSDPTVPVMELEDPQGNRAPAAATAP
ncbi:MAG: hypothetical protein WBB07_22855 [Mycobacterium sp.]